MEGHEILFRKLATVQHCHIQSFISMFDNNYYNIPTILNNSQLNRLTVYKF